MTTPKAEKPLCESCGKPIIHREGLNWCIDHEMSEKTLQNRVVARAKRKGWTVAHAGRGWVGNLETGEGQFVTQMAEGWPDLTLAKAGHRLIFMELKREAGEVSEDQWKWLQLLNECGAKAIIIRPSDLWRLNLILVKGSPL